MSDPGRSDRPPARTVRLVFLGPPGAGKGTQAAEFSRTHGIPHLSTGDLLRAAVSAQTPLGREADEYMRAGKLVPDALVLSILRERIAQPDARGGFILDGYPRNLAQAEALRAITEVDLALWFELPNAELVARLAGRRVCPRCHRVYNVHSQPPRSEGLCDEGHGALVQRSDDRPEAVAERLRVYARDTQPLLDHFRQRGLLRTVDASGSPAEVAARLARLLGSVPID